MGELARKLHERSIEEKRKTAYKSNDELEPKTSSAQKNKEKLPKMPSNKNVKELEKLAKYIEQAFPGC